MKLFSKLMVVLALITLFGCGGGGGGGSSLLKLDTPQKVRNAPLVMKQVLQTLPGFIGVTTTLFASLQDSTITAVACELGKGTVSLKSSNANGAEDNTFTYKSCSLEGSTLNGTLQVIEDGVLNRITIIASMTMNIPGDDNNMVKISISKLSYIEDENFGFLYIDGSYKISGVVDQSESCINGAYSIETPIAIILDSESEWVDGEFTINGQLYVINSDGSLSALIDSSYVTITENDDIVCSE